MPTAPTVKGRIVSYAGAQALGKRENQEDHFAVQELTTVDGHLAVLALVADGVGGHSQGEVASELAARQVPLRFVAQAPEAGNVGQALRRAVEETGLEIYQASLADAVDDRMGTTCTAFVAVDRRLYLCHAGDTRLYWQHGTEIHQVTIDHTWAEDAIQAGFPVELMRVHPNRGVLRRFLGIDSTLEVDTHYRLSESGTPTGDTLVDPLQLAPGDVLLLGTDGLTDVLTLPEIDQILRSGGPGVAATGLVQKALESGATDNVTAVVLHFAGSTQRRNWLSSWMIAASVVLLVVLLATILLALRLSG